VHLVLFVGQSHCFKKKRWVVFFSWMPLCFFKPIRFPWVEPAPGLGLARKPSTPDWVVFVFTVKQVLTY